MLQLSFIWLWAAGLAAPGTADRAADSPQAAGPPSHPTLRFLTGGVLQLATGSLQAAAVGPVAEAGRTLALGGIALPAGHWPQALQTYSAVEQQVWALPQPKENNGSNPHK